MNKETIKIFLGGDVFGPVGMRSVENLLPEFLNNEGIDFCVINGENASGGIGLSEEDAHRILAAGADVITGGNHSFEKKDYWAALSQISQLIRPANFPQPINGSVDPTPGRGYGVFEKDGLCYAVLNLQGRQQMTPIDCPFRTAEGHVSQWNSQEIPPIILIDFHAESPQEKEALGLMFAGRVSAVVGTHTHVQTADERILDDGTAYITDLGMIGPILSVIGADPKFAIKRNITQVLYRMELPETSGALRGIVVSINPKTRQALAVKRVEVKED